jgi:hypothetical protein
MWSYGIVALIVLLSKVKKPNKKTNLPIAQNFTTDDVLEYHFKSMDETDSEVEFWAKMNLVEDEIFLNECRKEVIERMKKFGKLKKAYHQKEINKILKD